MKFKTRGVAKNLSLDTSTWPPKGPKGGKGTAEDSRPRTATLDKPVVLDVALLGHLDMTTLTRRGLINVCRYRRGKGVIGVLTPVPTAASPRTSLQPSRTSSRSDLSGDEAATPGTGSRRRAAGPLVRQKKTVIEEDEGSSWAEDSGDRYGTYRVRRNNRLNRTFRVPALSRTPKRQPLNNIILNNNNNSDTEAKPGRGRRTPLAPNLDDILGSKEQVPEPCRTCGRPELPERLHSHPKQPKAPVSHHGYGHLPQARAPPEVVTPQQQVKSTVKKPVAIKYQARRSSEGATLQAPSPLAARTRSPGRRGASPAKGSLHGPGRPYFLDADLAVSPSRATKGPRTVTCYVCGREFGTASLPLHEPQCIQKWQLQNSKLPATWQRQLPEKPAGPITLDDWNKFAWESSKLAMAHPTEDFAVVVYEAEDEPLPPPNPSPHPQQPQAEEEVDERRIVPPSSRKAYMEVLRTNWFHLKSDEYLGADSVQCPNCLRRFCPDRINSHERVCFKRQHTTAGEPPPLADPVSGSAPRVPRGGSPLVECYLCGKKFGTRSIGIHEPQCLKKWQQTHSEQPQPALDKPRDCPQIEGPADRKPLAIEFPTKQPAAPSATPAPTPVRKEPPRATAEVKSAWAGEEGVLLDAGAPRQAPPPAPAPKLATGGRGRPLRCYLCGQMFGLQSLSIHEPQCLQKWRLENAKLPPQQQRPEPEKPEIIFTDTGEVDYDASADAAWQAHLSQLIGCSHCGRKFSPERIDTHERCCKGGSR